MPTILNHFDALTSHGLKVIPLRENSKVPLCKGWTDNWDLEFARMKLQQYPESNIGILLGDIVDVEGDSEEANRIVLDLIGDYPHPTYRSTKSIHHLFMTPDSELRHFRWQQIEFRGHGHQSVLPPSHTGGIVYKWLAKFKFPVPPMPQELVEFLENKKRQEDGKSRLKPGHIRTLCACCQKPVLMHKKRHSLELQAFKLLGQKWECHDCRTIDMRPACRLIRSGVPHTVVLINAFDPEQVNNQSCLEHCRNS